MIICPQCDTENPEVTRIERLYVQAETYVGLAEDRGSIYEQTEAVSENEVIDHDRDATVWRCDSCGHDALDLDEFYAEDEDEILDDAGENVTQTQHAVW